MTDLMDFVMVPGMAPGTDNTELDAKIKKLRTEHPEMTYEQIARELGDTKNHIQSRVQAMIRAGELESRNKDHKLTVSRKEWLGHTKRNAPEEV